LVDEIFIIVLDAQAAFGFLYLGTLDEDGSVLRQLFFP
jgi:hypothetical protein